MQPGEGAAIKKAIEKGSETPIYTGELLTGGCILIFLTPKASSRVREPRPSSQPSTPTRARLGSGEVAVTPTAAGC